MVNYPSCIIPKLKNLSKIDVDTLLADGDFYIVRRLDVDSSRIRNRVGGIDPMALSKDDIPDMSMNLLGGLYIIDHLKYKTIKNGSSPWDGKSKISVKNFTDKITTLETFSALYIPLRALHGVDVPFQAPDKKQYKQAYKDFPFEKKYQDDLIKMLGHCEVRHDPTVLNYWHVVLDVVNPFTQTPTKNAKNAFNTFACDSIINNIISKVAKETLPRLVKIKTNHYIKS